MVKRIVDKVTGEHDKVEQLQGSGGRRNRAMAEDGVEVDSVMATWRSAASHLTSRVFLSLYLKNQAPLFPSARPERHDTDAAEAKAGDGLTLLLATLLCGWLDIPLWFLDGKAWVEDEEIKMKMKRWRKLHTRGMKEQRRM
ncbi:unnamed protein product [Pleuronectes platessa]|uniref:Uncharacterized protein n=1 Tax=Pleuronectes platessa TaxID=8262 RepID=A0A9N7U1T9_PLEPL|nr:unnamed protein product [Pleuronectes platessa]